MKCKIDGCYARPYRRNMCHAHFQAWTINTSFERPRLTRKGTLREPEAATCQHEPELIVWWNCYQCRKCGIPLPTMEAS